MSLNDVLLQDMKQAMKEREAGKLRVAVLRLLRAEIKNEELARRRDLNDDEIRQVVMREVKKRREVIPDFERAGRPEAVARLHEEIEILQAYLPPQLDEQQVREVIAQVIEACGAQGPKDVGRVMKEVMPRLAGRADGKLVNQLVKEALA
ncbi:MAG: GatB/YqeY domain-containing protein [Syntrophomonadaceae bacterium]|nr:GatB/YqeY domain-containing protein [Syntrophomonadaceae bacterium]MDH7497863.1 GatB/YqeY domain-containing protein [Syntrophomonadaceae bacterium]